MMTALLGFVLFTSLIKNIWYEAFTFWQEEYKFDFLYFIQQSCFMAGAKPIKYACYAVLSLLGVAVDVGIRILTDRTRARCRACHSDSTRRSSIVILKLGPTFLRPILYILERVKVCNFCNSFSKAVSFRPAQSQSSIAVMLLKVCW